MPKQKGVRREGGGASCDLPPPRWGPYGAPFAPYGPYGARRTAWALYGAPLLRGPYNAPSPSHDEPYIHVWPYGAPPLCGPYNGVGGVVARNVAPPPDVRCVVDRRAQRPLGGVNNSAGGAIGK